MWVSENTKAKVKSCSPKIAISEQSSSLPSQRAMTSIELIQTPCQANSWGSEAPHAARKKEGDKLRH